MSTIRPAADLEADPRVKAVFDDIRATRKSDFINNMWLYLAFDPALLESTWREVKAVMATPSTLDPLVKEMLYIAVSVTNGCSYCVHSHTAAAKAKGMSPAQHAELLAIISLAGKTNQLATALQLPVDAAFAPTATDQGVAHAIDLPEATERAALLRLCIGAGLRRPMTEM
jgi:AhpD family alkylhydroperoxidase